MNIKLSLLTLASSLLLIGCYVERPHGYARGSAIEASYSYVYYPDAEVYYYPQRHVYYWSDGGTWRSGSRVPPNYVLQSHVTVNLKSPEPYQEHEQVRTQHPHQSKEGKPGRGNGRDGR